MLTCVLFQQAVAQSSIDHALKEIEKNNKSLHSNGIIQFLQDQGYYYTTYDKYLQLEWEYQQAVSRLYKFSL